MHVLYATDGSTAAVHARETILGLADPTRVRVTVVSVVPTGWPALKHLPEVLRQTPDRRSVAVDAADVAADRLRLAGFTVATATPEGRPDEVIAATAAARGADLLVLGTGPSLAVVGRLLGSTTTALLHGPTPVLVTQRPPTAGRPQVVMATDGSAPAVRAAGLAANLLDPARCEVVVLSVGVLRTASPGAPYGGYAVSALSEDVGQEILAPARQHAAEAAAVFAECGFPVSTQAVMGHPLTRVLAIADTADASLVVVGSRGTSYPDRAFMGSVSDQVVRHAPATLVGR